MKHLFGDLNSGIDELSEMAKMIDKNQAKLKKLSDEYKDNSFDYSWCETCQEYIHNDDQEWIHGDLAVCPKCHTNLEM